MPPRSTYDAEVMTIKTSTAMFAAFASVTTLTMFAAGQSASPGANAPHIPQVVRDRVQRGGSARVIVELNLATGAHVPEGQLPNRAAIAAQRSAIRAAHARLRSKVPGAVVREYDTVPYVALEVTAAGLAALENAAGDAVRIFDDELMKPVLADSVPLIQGDQVWDAGYDGSGMMVAVVDTGVDSAHPFLAGKVIEEACYSTTSGITSKSVCPNGQAQQFGSGAAAPCTLSDCIHGTHVAGIATGNGVSAGVAFSGVAKGAQLMAVQVFSEIDSILSCGGAAPCLRP